VKVEDTAGPKPSMAIARRGDIAVSNVGSVLLAADPERVQDELSWRADRLTFNDVELGEAAAEFNRYNQKKLVVIGPAATRIRIGGSFEPDKLDAFVRLLHDAYDLKVEDHGDEITITG
jgi:transmembrane sensor